MVTDAEVLDGVSESYDVSNEFMATYEAWLFLLMPSIIMLYFAVSYRWDSLCTHDSRDRCHIGQWRRF